MDRLLHQKNWVLTAFKVRQGTEKGLSTHAIRMSFQTDVPFNPYRVPKSNSGSGRLIIYFVSNGDYSAKVDEKRWDHKTWSAAIEPKTLAYIAESAMLSLEAIPEHSSVTCYVQKDWTLTPSDYVITLRPSPNPLQPSAYLFCPLLRFWLAT